MRILVCGDRNWVDYDLIENTLLDILINEHGDDDDWNFQHQTDIISGHAKGADSLGEKFAKAHTVRLHVFPAQWDKYGRGAGPIRNQQMLDEGHPDLVLAFHDDLAHSRGTAHMVRIARKAGIPVKVVRH